MGVETLIAFGAGLLVILWVLNRWRNRPRKIYRRRPVIFTEEIVTSLAVSVPGSVTVIEHAPTKRFLQFRKVRADSFEIVFGFPRAPWSKQFWSSVNDALRRSDFQPSSDEIMDPRSGSEMEYLQVTIKGNLEEVASDAVRLIRAVLPAIDLSANDEFDFYYEGRHNVSAVRKANQELFEEAARHPNALIRQSARRQLDHIEESDGRSSSSN